MGFGSVMKPLYRLSWRRSSAERPLTILCCGTSTSLPFAPGEHGKVAVKIVDDRGIESLKVVPLP